jgi:hypothetical protein
MYTNSMQSVDPLNVIRDHLLQAAKGGWAMYVYVVKPDRFKTESMRTPIKKWNRSPFRDEDAWFVRITRRMHSISGFEGWYDVANGNCLLTFGRNDGRAVKMLKLNGLMEWMKNFPIVAVIIQSTGFRRTNRRVLFDCRYDPTCYAGKFFVRPFTKAMKDRWLPDARGRLAFCPHKDSVLPELRALPPRDPNDLMHKYVLPLEGGTDYLNAKSRFRT